MNSYKFQILVIRALYILIWHATGLGNKPEVSKWQKDAESFIRNKESEANQGIPGTWP